MCHKSTHFLSTSRGCDSTIPLFSLPQCLTTPLGKEFFLTSNLNFPQHFLHPVTCYVWDTSIAQPVQEVSKQLEAGDIYLLISLLLPTPLEDFPIVPSLGQENKKGTREVQTTSAESAASSGTKTRWICFLLRNCKGRKRISGSENQHCLSWICGALLIQSRLQQSRGCCRLICHFWTFPVMLTLRQKLLCRCSAQKSTQYSTGLIPNFCHLPAARNVTGNITLGVMVFQEEGRRNLTLLPRSQPRAPDPPHGQHLVSTSVFGPLLK